ncbi:MAG: hypothetical protein WKF76_06120 [Nocardioidaceae bacterium]
MALTETSTTDAAAAGAESAATQAVGHWLRLVVLVLGALVFLFPFYYMIDRLPAGGAGHLAGGRRPDRRR